MANFLDTLKSIPSCHRQLTSRSSSIQVAFRFAKQGERPPNSLLRPEKVLDRQCIVASSIVLTALSLITGLLAAAAISGVGPLRTTSPVMAPIFKVFVVLFCFLSLSSIVMAWRMYFIYSKDPRQYCARMLKMQRRMLRRVEARARGVAHTSFEQWCAQRFTRNFGRFLRLVGRAMLYFSFALFVTFGLIAYFVAMGGRSSVPAWLLTLLLLFLPNTANPQSIYGAWFFSILIMYLGKRLASLGAMVIKHGQGPLRADELFLN